MIIIGKDDSRYPRQILPLLERESPDRIWMLGDPSLLRLETIALFASVDCPGSIILRAVEYIRDQVGAETCFAGGFQSPLEQECFRMLLRMEARMILFPARSIIRLRIPSQWRPSLERGSLLVVSSFDKYECRSTARRAMSRNRFAAAVADRVLLIHTSEGGKLSRLARDVIQWRKDLVTIGDPRNRVIVEMGARIVEKRKRDNTGTDLVLT